MLHFVYEMECRLVFKVLYFFVYLYSVLMNIFLLENKNQNDPVRALKMTTRQTLIEIWRYPSNT